MTGPALTWTVGGRPAPIPRVRVLFRPTDGIPWRATFAFRRSDGFDPSGFRRGDLAPIRPWIGRKPAAEPLLALYRGRGRFRALVPYTLNTDGWPSALDSLGVRRARARWDRQEAAWEEIRNGSER